MTAALLVVGEDVLSQHLEVRLVRREREHDQIRIETVDDVFRVRIVLAGDSLTADEIHDLVFSFAGDGGVRNDDFQLRVESKLNLARTRHTLVRDVPLPSPDPR